MCESRGDHLKGRHWQRFARECGLNPKLVLDRVGALAKAAIAEVGAAESEVCAMPAGGHSVLDQTRQAVERRARAVLAELQELEDNPIAEVAEDKRMSPPPPQSRARFGLVAEFDFEQEAAQSSTFSRGRPVSG
jgi:hypothetical protein